jgi:hypothetical protein
VTDNEFDALMDQRQEDARQRRARCNYIITLGDRGATYVGPFDSYERYAPMPSSIAKTNGAPPMWRTRAPRYQS